MRFYHGTNSITLMNIIKDGALKPLKETNKQNLCFFTTTMQDDVIYLTTEKMFAGFYSPQYKQMIEDKVAYGCILEIELPFDKHLFRPDEDYMDSILQENGYELYNKYLKAGEYIKYVDFHTTFLKLEQDISAEDINFRYLLSINKEIGYKILSETDASLSLELGNVAYIGNIPISCIKAIHISNILETTIYEVTENAINKAMEKVDFCFGDIVDEEGVTM